MSVKFLRQLSGPLLKEWHACHKHGLKNQVGVTYVNIAELADFCECIDRDYIPIGSVEFTQEYCSHVDIILPSNFSYGINPGQLDEFLMRKITRRPYDNVASSEFVKPVRLKLFDAGKKADIANQVYYVNPDVWASEFVTFGAEFRYYVYDGRILGWCRYDNLDEKYPDPNHNIVEAIVNKINTTTCGTVPIAYSVDIGYRIDLDCYCLVEINDFWSLGWYTFDDPQSNPITSDQYAQSIIDRWLQISCPSVHTVISI